ncbi:MAG: Gfo/Idh/MocA family oxidoreductase [candidate division WOR-3 bacterium]|nr:MAG: Gfo/Idh/MocA family oxidoreductase [candidate division WOR-3 bacterium]
MATKKKLNCAVIGVGNMGRHHARVYAEMKNVNLVAIADVHGKSVHGIAGKYKCEYYKDYRRMLDTEKPDAVTVAVPTSLHREVALACIDRHIPVLIEKPIAESIRSAKDIINRGKAKKVPVCIGHVERFNPVIQKLKQLIVQRRFGHIISIGSKRVGLFPPQVLDTDVIIDLAVHDIDICNYLLGLQPTTVNARAGKALNNKMYDYADILLGYNGIDVHIQVNWITPVKVRQLSLTGTKGYAELNYLNQTLRIYKSSYKKKIDSYGEYVVRFGSPQTKELSLTGKEPLKLELQNFIEHIKYGNSNIVTAGDGLAALEIALKAIRAADRSHNKS